MTFGGALFIVSGTKTTSGTGGEINDEKVLANIKKDIDDNCSVIVCRAFCGGAYFGY
jgi:hypothetical protein